MRYVVLPAEVIGEIMDGQRNTLPVTVPPEPGETIGLRTDHRRRATCLMDIAAVEPDQDGWVILLRPHIHEDTPRLLPRSLRPPAWATDEHGYTHMAAFALTGEPEAIDPDQLNPNWSAGAQRRHGKARADKTTQDRAARHTLTTEQRMADARKVSQHNYVDLRDEFRVLRHMHKSGKTDAAVVQLERIERIAHREAA